MSNCREFSFKHWETGRLIILNLSDAWPHQEKLDLICPFDQTNLIFSYNNIDKWVYCPNCNTQYSVSNSIYQETVNKECIDSLVSVQKRIKSLDRTREDLTKILKHAYNIGLINKANLSEQGKE
jgi:hypothetical protein